MIRLACLVLAVLCTTVLTAVQVPQAQQTTSTEPLALVNANVVNVHDGKIAMNATIVLRDGRIASVGTGGAPAGVKALWKSLTAGSE